MFWRKLKQFVQSLLENTNIGVDETAICIALLDAKKLNPKAKGAALEAIAARLLMQSVGGISYAEAKRYVRELRRTRDVCAD